MMQVPKVFIVDSKSTLESFYKDFLSFREFETVFFDNVDEVLRAISKTKPDLIVADVPALADGEKISAIAEHMGIALIYASNFKDFEYESLPEFVRIVNKPFQSIHLRFSVRAELAKRSSDQNKPTSHPSNLRVVN